MVGQSRQEGQASERKDEKLLVIDRKILVVFILYLPYFSFTLRDNQPLAF